MLTIDQEAELITEIAIQTCDSEFKQFVESEREFFAAMIVHERYDEVMALFFKKGFSMGMRFYTNQLNSKNKIK